MNAQQNDSSHTRLGPGDTLQSARIAIGMTLDDVANKMHLSTSILSSLEENNFEDITAPIFVKGYLRAYARLVKVNEEEIIQQYVTSYMNGDPPISSISNTTPELNANDARVKWTTYLVILALIGLLSTWWWNRYQQSPETLSLESDGSQTIAAESEPGTEPAGGLGQMLEKIENAETHTLSQQGEEKSPEGTTQEVGLVQDEVTQTEAQESAGLEQDETVVAELETPPESDSGQLVVEPPVPELTPDELADAPASMTEMPAVQSQDGLVITVNADTWASVSDADGKRLVYDLLRAGRELTVSGKAPLSVFFGNGYGVDLVYQGKPVDLSQVIKSNNTARMIIGQ